MQHSRDRDIILQRLQEPRRFLQILTGPRQIGKTTVVRDVLKTLRIPNLYFSARTGRGTDAERIADRWEQARAESARHGNSDVVLVLDDMESVDRWPEIVKREWDADTWNERPVKILLIGSSRLLRGPWSVEPLFGRFEEIRMTHRTYLEMREAYGVSLEEFIHFGSYPGAASLLNEPKRWEQLIRSAVIESTLTRDVFEGSRIANAALLRRTLELGISYSGRILSLTKLLGELQDRGNTTTIAGYIEKF